MTPHKHQVCTVCELPPVWGGCGLDDCPMGDDNEDDFVVDELGVFDEEPVTA